MKNKAQLDGMPVWFDGKSINEALFCEEFLRTHKIIFTNGAFFTPEGRVTDELPLRGEIFEELKCCAVSNIPRKISNIVELMKLAAPDLLELGVIDGIIPEPEGGAHLAPAAHMRQVDRALSRCLAELSKESGAALAAGRYQKFRRMGAAPQKEEA